MWIIQVEVKAMAVVLDSELFSCRYTQTQYYTLTTPTGRSGSKNERPNNTHLNLGGTQMSPVFLELHQALLHLPLKLCKLLFCVFILCCSQYCLACLSCDPWSSRDMVEIGPQGPCEPIQKHLLVCTVPYTIYLPLYTDWGCHKSSRRQTRGRFRTVVRIRCYLVLARSLTRFSLPTTTKVCPLKPHIHYMHQLLTLCVRYFLIKYCICSWSNNVI